MASHSLPHDPSEQAAVRGHLNKMLDRLVIAHRQFNEANAVRVAAAYEERWEILNELEEFLRDACIELTPDDLDLAA
jgi:hypothetical protein